MKRALSLVLAVLMIAGCMSFVVSAEEATWDIPAILEENGTEHIKLDTAIGVPPVQDGVINESEYSKKVVTTGENVYHNAELVYNEYFAYDATWVYYGIEATGTATLGTDPVFAVEAAKYNVAPADMGDEYFYANWGDMIMYNRYGNGERGWEFTTAATRALANEEMPGTYSESRTSDRWLTQYGTNYATALGAWCSIGVNKEKGQEQTVYEIKFNRSKLLSNDKVYAFYMYDIGINSVLLFDRLSNDDKADLGISSVYMPRYIMLGEDPKMAAKNYATANPGDLLYAVNFAGDGSFSPAPLTDLFTANFSATASQDGSAVTIAAKAGATDQTLSFWGAPIKGLAANADTHYTMVYKVASNSASDVKNNSVGIGGLHKGTAGLTDFYNNYSNHDVPATQTPRAAISFANTKQLDYVLYSGIDAYDVDADGFVTMVNDFDGTTYTTYILKDGAEATIDAEMTNWIKLQTLEMELTDKANIFFGVYCFYNVINTTIKDVKIYKGLNGAAAEFDIPTLLEEAGASNIVLDAPVAVAPVQDGTISDGEYNWTNTITKDGCTNGEDVIFTGAASLAESESIVEYMAYDADYLYYAVKVTKAGYVGKEIYVNMTGIPGPLTNGEKNTLYAYGNLDAGGAPYAWYGFTGSSATLFGLPNAVRESLLKDFPELNCNKGGTLASTHAGENKLAFNALMGDVGFNSDKSIFEMKFSRKYIASNVFAMMNMINPEGGAPNRLHFRAAVTAEHQDALKMGATNGPRFVVIENDEMITNGKASVRISPVQNGLRFKTSVNNAFIAELEAVEGNVVEVGTLIAPTDTLGGAKLTHEFAGKKLDVKATLDAPFAEGALYNTYAGSITSLNDYNLEREFTAVGYIKVTNGENVEYYYSTTSASRSAAYVAEKALEDAESYTATQLELIQALIPAKVEA